MAQPTVAALAATQPDFFGLVVPWSFFDNARFLAALGGVSVPAGPYYDGVRTLDYSPIYAFATFQLTGVPEPDAWALTLLGLGGAGLVLRQRRRIAAA